MSFEQLALYATFTLNEEVKDYFIGLILISKVVGTHLSAINIMSALKRFFRDLDIPLKNAKFTCMDTTLILDCIDIFFGRFRYLILLFANQCKLNKWHQHFAIEKC